MIPLKVLGDRVLVQPDVLSNAPTQTSFGLYMAQSMAAAITGEDCTTSVHRGTVIAVGNPTHPLKHEADVLADKVDVLLDFNTYDSEEVQTFEDVAHMLRDLVRKQPSVAVGDDVLFSHDAGQQITLDGETYILLRESELLAVVEPEKEAA